MRRRASHPSDASREAQVHADAPTQADLLPESNGQSQHHSRACPQLSPQSSSEPQTGAIPFSTGLVTHADRAQLEDFEEVLLSSPVRRQPLQPRPNAPPLQGKMLTLARLWRFTHWLSTSWQFLSSFPRAYVSIASAGLGSMQQHLCSPVAGTASLDKSEVDSLKQRLTLLKSEMVSTAASQEQEQQEAEEV